LFAADAKLLQRLAPQIRRVLIVDPNAAQARLLAELMRSVGAREILFETEEYKALELAYTTGPSILFVERSGLKLDGESFTRRLRRSDFSCRKAPVIMVTSDATATAIKGARDCGVHEFLRKPFTSGDLMKRLEAVSLKPRDWVEGVHYVGPDRRRFNSAEFTGQQKRRADKVEQPADTRARALYQSVRILKAAISQFDTDPAQARRAIVEQAALLKQIAADASSPRLAEAVASLALAAAENGATRASLSGPVKDVLDLFETVISVRAA
jgi:CheY-like chemotaxis protein